MAGRIYNKLDTFLKKKLDADTFERMRHRDSCIVCSKKEDKAFKFVILSDEWIYLTENPPQNISQEVHLKDIVSVRLIDKKPEFLQGDEQARVQHIEIVHEVEPDVTKNKKLNKKSNGSLSDRSITSSRSDTALMQMRSDGSRHVHFTRKNSLDDFQTLQKKKVNKSKKKTSTKRGDSIEEEANESLSLYLPESSNECLKKSDSETTMSSARSTSSLKNFFSFRKQPSEEDELAMTGIPVYCGGDIIFMQGDSDEIAVPRQTQVLDIYILDQYSPFLRYVKGAIQNHVIDGTLSKDPKIASRKELCVEDSNVKTPRAGTSEKLELLFNQLRTELLNPSNTIVDNFQLVRELKNAAERIYFIKKMFWKSSEVCKFLLDELHFYVPISQTKILDLDIAERAKRADELEYATLICSTLKIMLRGTEIIQSRTKIMLSGGAEKVHNLMLAITCLPDIPGDYDDDFFSLDVRPSNANSSGQFKQKHTGKNTTLLNLAEGFLDASISLLFEIFNFAQQSVDDYPDFTTEWCTLVLEKKDEEGELLVVPFLEVLLIRLLRTFAPISDNDCPLTPIEHVDVYCKVFILNDLVRTSEVLLNEIRQRFYEEFKYYISPYLVKKRLCKDYPLYSRIADCLTDTVSTILEKDVIFS